MGKKKTSEPSSPSASASEPAEECPATPQTPRHFDPALHIAAGNNDISLIKQLVAAGYDVNCRDYDGRTALHVAASRGHTDMVRYLVSVTGVDVNAKDHRNRTPVMDVQSGRDDLTQLMTHSGAIEDPNYFTETQPNEETSSSGKDLKKEESIEVVDAKFLRRLFITVMAPFVFLLFVNGIVFAIEFMMCSCMFYLIMSGYFVSDITAKPPWHRPRPGAKELTLSHLPDYWGAAVHNPKHDFGIDFESVEIQTEDGYTLRGWYVPATGPNKKKTGIVFAHGGGRDRRAWFRHMPVFHRRGYSLIMFDFREHGLSQGSGKGLQFGMAERYDVIAATKWMRETKGFQKIAAIGTSMGASSAIMAAAIDKSIDIVVAENALLTCAHLQDKHMINIFTGYFHGNMWSNSVFRAFRFGASNWLNLRVGNKPSKKCQAMHVIGKLAPRPVLLMHGTYDDVVPPYHSENLFELANEPKELWLCPGSKHCMLYNIAPTEYESRVFTFLERHGD